MKITNQDISPELAELYASLISTTQTGAFAGLLARTRRQARISANKQRRTINYADITAAVEILMERLGYTRGTKDFRDAVRLEKFAINSGTWNPAYWQKCEILTNVFLVNSPVSVPDDTPPPYGYRDQNNMPTIPTYGTGSADNGPARYNGIISTGYFHDVTLAWRRTVYKLAQAIDQDLIEPAIISFEGTLTVESSTRGSRPMFSLIMRNYLGDSNSTSLTTTANPVDKVPPASPPTIKGCQSLYWRYKIPADTAPYYNAIKLRIILRNLARLSTIDAAGNMTRAVIITAPRPMFGRGFNNNTSVVTQLTGTPDIYQILPQVPPHSGIGGLATYYAQQGNFNTSINGKEVKWNSSWTINYLSDGFLATTQLHLIGLTFGITVESFTCKQQGFGSSYYHWLGTFFSGVGGNIIVAANGNNIEWSSFYLDFTAFGDNNAAQVNVIRRRKTKDGNITIISTTPTTIYTRASYQLGTQYAASNPP